MNTSAAFGHRLQTRRVDSMTAQLKSRNFEPNRNAGDQRWDDALLVCVLCTHRR
jgi:hypothetical protein